MVDEEKSDWLLRVKTCSTSLLMSYLLPARKYPQQTLFVKCATNP